MYANNNLKFPFGINLQIWRYILLKYLDTEDIVNAHIAFNILKKKQLKWLLTDPIKLIFRKEMDALNFLEKWKLLHLSAENRIGSGIPLLVQNLDKTEKNLNLAITYGHYTVADYFFPYAGKNFLHSVLSRAVRNKDWKCIEWIFSKGYKFSGETVNYAIVHGKIRVLKMFFSEFKAENVHLYLAAQTSAKSVRWLCKNIYYKNAVINRAFLIACKYGQYETVKWFINFTGAAVTNMAVELARPHLAVYVLILKLNSI